MLVLALGCGRPGNATDLDEALRPPSATVGKFWPTLIADADARVLSPALRDAALHTEPEVRALATRLIGRLEIDAALPLLELALADAEPGIRLDAARGIARHPGLSPVEREALLLGAFASAPSQVSRTYDPSSELALRGELLQLLADIWPNASNPALARVFDDPTDAAAQADGCRALGRLAQRGHAPPPELAAKLHEIILANTRDATTLECALALRQPALAARLPRDRPHDLARLVALAAESAPALAVPVLDLLAQLPIGASLPAIEALALEAEPGTAVAATRAFARQAPLARLLALAHAQIDRARGDRLPILLELFAGLESHVQQPEVAELAERAVGRLEPMKAQPRREAEARALAQCAAARLADLARQWPKHTFVCGAGIAPDSVRDTGIAHVIGRAHGSDPLRADHLERLFKRGPRAVQLEVVHATAGLPVELAALLLAEALTSPDPRVLASALRGIAARAPELRATRVRAALIASSERASASAESALAFLGAAQALLRPSADTPLDPEVRATLARLAEHPARGLREPARALLDEWQQPLPAGHRALETRIDPSRVLAPDARFHVKLATSAGSSIELELHARLAPLAVRALVDLVEAGALDGSPIDSLVPGRLAAFLPETEPGFALRHEDFDGPVVEGSVVLQDHGRDAVGPGFAIVLARTPELDRRVTAVGRVTSNLHAIAALRPGDRIERATLIGAR